MSVEVLNPILITSVQASHARKSRHNIIAVKNSRTMIPSPVSLTAGQQANRPAVRIILPAWFDHLEERFSYNEVHFKTFLLRLKTSCPHTENVKL